ncbi:ribokinase [Palleronia salina]|uniref:Ribokinase n=1 Tax=Palleronia salina TaxID=313368 RepID=A0A1M6LWB4_9RHOB|nr:ribokinase [Palleronia salina]
MAAPEDNARSRRATIKDVARLAAVSVGTVSHVLNDSKGVSSAARKAVLDAVETLDYRPNSLARSLIARRPRNEVSARPDRPRLICVGYISIDYMVRIGEVPSPGARATSHSIDKMLGGPAANVAAFAAGLGAPLDLSVELVTRLGHDPDSVWALEELAARGVDASGALQEPGTRLSRCIVLVEDGGRRTIVNEPFHIPAELLARRLTVHDGATAPACVHFDGFHLGAAEEVAADLHAAGFRMALHGAGLPETRRGRDDMAGLLGTFDLLVLNRETLDAFAPAVPEAADAPERLFGLSDDARCKALLITDGAAGATLYHPGETPLHCPAPGIDVVDATGAGDAFTGIFLAAWLSSGDAPRALELATRGASLSLESMGAQGRIPTAASLGVADTTTEIAGAER